MRTHRRIAWAAVALAAVVAPAIVEAQRGVVLPQMAPGEYSLCRLHAGVLPDSIARASAPWVTEILPPGGSRSLAAPLPPRTASPALPR